MPTDSKVGAIIERCALHCGALEISEGLLGPFRAERTQELIFRVKEEQ